jgi:hypothetical protein
MAFAFDTLGYAKHLAEAGVDRQQAEAHAEAARQFIMTELVTKEDMRLNSELIVNQMTVRLGGIIVASLAALGVLLRLTSH